MPEVVATEPLEPTALRDRILAAIRGPKNQTHAVVFQNLDHVPVGSSGYFSPLGNEASRTLNGWMVDNGSGSRVITPEDHWIFTSRSGPANDEKLADVIAAELLPEHHILVEFEAVTGHEPGDWESSLPGYDWTTFGSAEVLGHHLNQGELARLYFEIEANGSLNESDAYAELEKSIKTLSEAAADAVREQTQSASRNALLFGPAPTRVANTNDAPDTDNS